MTSGKSAPPSHFLPLYLIPLFNSCYPSPVLPHLPTYPHMPTSCLNRVPTSAPHHLSHSLSFTAAPQSPIHLCLNISSPGFANAKQAAWWEVCSFAHTVTGMDMTPSTCACSIQVYTVYIRTLHQLYIKPLSDLIEHFA